MNKTHAAAHVGVPFMTVIGASLATLAIVGISHDTPQATSRQPTSTVTVTQPAAPVTGPTATRTATPVPSTSGPQPTAAVVSVADRATAMPHTSSGGQSHAAARPPSSPQPSPSAAPCGGRVLTVRALADRACLSVGK